MENLFAVIFFQKEIYLLPYFLTYFLTYLFTYLLTVFPYFLICAEFSKRLRKVSLNKGILKCKTFIPTLSKLTRTCRRVLLWSHATQSYLPT